MKRAAGVKRDQSFKCKPTPSVFHQLYLCSSSFEKNHSQDDIQDSRKVFQFPALLSSTPSPLSFYFLPSFHSNSLLFHLLTWRREIMCLRIFLVSYPFFSVGQMLSHTLFLSFSLSFGSLSFIHHLFDICFILWSPCVFEKRCITSLFLLVLFFSLPSSCIHSHAKSIMGEKGSWVTTCCCFLGIPSHLFFPPTPLLYSFDSTGYPCSVSVLCLCSSCSEIEKRDATCKKVPKQTLSVNRTLFLSSSTPLLESSSCFSHQSIYCFCQKRMQKQSEYKWLLLLLPVFLLHKRLSLWKAVCNILQFWSSQVEIELRLKV